MDTVRLNLGFPGNRFYRRRQAQELLPQDVARIHRSPDFGPAFMEYVKHYDPSALQRSFPALCRALEVARSFGDVYSELISAAEIVVNYGGKTLSETTLCALLLSETAPSDMKHLRRIFFPENASKEFWFRVYTGLAALRRARGLPLSIIISAGSPTTVIDHQALMRRILVRGQAEPHLLLSQLALEFYRARYRLLTNDLIDQLMFVVAPLAERHGYGRFAEDVKDHVLRHSLPPKEYDRYQSIHNLGFIDEPTALNLTNNLKDIIREELTANLPEGKVESVQCRIKREYSFWEKENMRYLEGDTYLSEDLIGVEIVLADVAVLRSAVELLKNAAGLCPPGPKTAKKYPEVYRAIREGRIKLVKDNIARPRPSGYSAYTMLLEYGEGHLVEFKLTTPERKERNTEGEAAHWRYKLQRTAKLFGRREEQDYHAEEPREDEHLVLISPYEHIFAFTIQRLPSHQKYLSDLAEGGARRVSLCKTVCRRGRHWVDVVPAKIKEDLRLRDGMLIELK